MAEPRIYLADKETLDAHTQIQQAILAAWREAEGA